MITNEGRRWSLTDLKIELEFLPRVGVLTFNFYSVSGTGCNLNEHTGNRHLNLAKIRNPPTWRHTHTSGVETIEKKILQKNLCSFHFLFIFFILSILKNEFSFCSCSPRSLSVLSRYWDSIYSCLSSYSAEGSFFQCSSFITYQGKILYFLLFLNFSTFFLYNFHLFL